MRRRSDRHAARAHSDRPDASRPCQRHSGHRPGASRQRRRRAAVVGARRRARRERRRARARALPRAHAVSRYHVPPERVRGARRRGRRRPDERRHLVGLHLLLRHAARAARGARAGNARRHRGERNARRRRAREGERSRPGGDAPGRRQSAPPARASALHASLRGAPVRPTGDRYARAGPGPHARHARELLPAPLHTRGVRRRRRRRRGPAAGARDRGRAETQILAEIRRVRDAGVTDAELRRAITAAEAAHEFETETAEGRAIALGRAETIWTIEDEQAYVNRIRSVTATQVRAVARRYLDPERYTRLALLPPGGAR